MWDAATGAKQYTFEGHEAPVYSVCPHYKENIQVSFPLVISLIAFIVYFKLMMPSSYDFPFTDSFRIPVSLFLTLFLFFYA